MTDFFPNSNKVVETRRPLDKVRETLRCHLHGRTFLNIPTELLLFKATKILLEDYPLVTLRNADLSPRDTRVIHILEEAPEDRRQSETMIVASSETMVTAKSELQWMGAVQSMTLLALLSHDMRNPTLQQVHGQAALRVL